MLSVNIRKLENEDKRKNNRNVFCQLLATRLSDFEITIFKFIKSFETFHISFFF